MDVGYWILDFGCWISDARFLVKPNMKRISAHRRDDLLSILSGIDISVPPRGTNRTTAHTERWSICRLLSTLAWENKLDYPCVGRKSERPDYVFRLGVQGVGIEITEAVKEDLARTEVLPEANLSSVIDISLFKWRDKRKTLDELRQIARKTELTGPGWVGDEPYHEFADAISDKVEDKTRKLNEETFSRFDEDWLLIYENLTLPGADKNQAAEYLTYSLNNYWGSESFHRIFLESGEFIIELTRERLAMYRICDLWSANGA